jgi:hypothetical protein
MSAGASSATIPRDASTTKSLTFTLTYTSAGVSTPVGNTTVSITDKGSNLNLPSSAVTDSQGNITISVKSNSISATDVTDTVTASVDNVSASTSVLASGLTISLSSSKKYIYEQDLSNGFTAATITAYVYDHAGDTAKCSVDFSDSLGATLSATKGVSTSNGCASTTISTGTSDFTSTQTDVVTGTVTSTSISSTISINFLYATSINNQAVANITKGAQQYVSWKVLATDGNNFPGAKTDVSFLLPGSSLATTAYISTTSGWQISSSAATTATGSAYVLIYLDARPAISSGDIAFTVN